MTVEDAITYQTTNDAEGTSKRRSPWSPDIYIDKKLSDNQRVAVNQEISKRFASQYEGPGWIGSKDPKPRITEADITDSLFRQVASNQRLSTIYASSESVASLIPDSRDLLYQGQTREAFIGNDGLKTVVNYDNKTI